MAATSHECFREIHPLFSKVFEYLSTEYSVLRSTTWYWHSDEFLEVAVRGRDEGDCGDFKQTIKLVKLRPLTFSATRHNGIR